METRVLEARGNVVPLAALSALPMLGAAAGAWLDEQAHLGFTTWQSACRAAGLRFTSLVDFTWQLLPSAILGLLTGGLMLLVLGLGLGAGVARRCLAAHVGCVATLPIALVMCAQTLPVHAMLVADVALAAGVASWIARTPSHHATSHP